MLIKNKLFRLFPKEFQTNVRLFKIFKAVPQYLYLNNYKKIQIHESPDSFARIASSIISDGKTFLKYDRLYTFFQLIQQIEPETIIVEVGVYRGGSTKFMSYVVDSTGTENSIFACDTFAGHAVVDERYDGMHKANISFADVKLKDVQKYLQDCKNIQIIPGDIFKTFTQIPTDKPIGILHIDVDVYPATKFCLDTFSPRVVKGGFIVCDDYGFTSCKGAKVAIDEFCKTNKNWKSFHLLTGQAVLIKIAD